MIISICAAYDRNRIIGTNGRLPWRLPADLERFQTITLDKPIVMGRVTLESIGAPLPKRWNIVVTSAPDAPQGTTRAGSVDEAVWLARTWPEAVIIGGERIFADAIAIADRMFLTLVHGAFDGDRRFPRWNENEWRTISRTRRAADHDNPYDLEFLELSSMRQRYPAMT